MTSREYVETLMWTKSREGVKAATVMFLLDTAIQAMEDETEEETYPAK